MDWLVWTIIAIVGVVALVAVGFLIYKICKLPAEERKELIINWIVGLVTTAELEYVGKGRGKEKVEWVEEQFKQTAPWFLKILLSVTKSADLNDLIEKALEKAKNAFANQTQPPE